MLDVMSGPNTVTAYKIESNGVQFKNQRRLNEKDGILPGILRMSRI